MSVKSGRRPQGTVDKGHFGAGLRTQTSAVLFIWLDCNYSHCLHLYKAASVIDSRRYTPVKPKHSGQTLRLDQVTAPPAEPQDADLSSSDTGVH